MQHRGRHLDACVLERNGFAAGATFTGLACGLRCPGVNVTHCPNVGISVSGLGGLGRWSRARPDGVAMNVPGFVAPGCRTQLSATPLALLLCPAVPATYVALGDQEVEKVEEMLGTHNSCLSKTCRNVSMLLCNNRFCVGRPAVPCALF